VAERYQSTFVFQTTTGIHFPIPEVHIDIACGKFVQEYASGFGREFSFSTCVKGSSLVVATVQ
jgi:hypothetical protein